MKIDTRVVPFVIILLVGGCASPRTKHAGWPEYTGDIPFVKKGIDAIGQYKREQRLQIRNGINEIAFKLLTIGQVSPLRKAKSKLMEESNMPIIAVYDRDLDGNADTYTHLATDETSTTDFGFVFDLNRDGGIDYAVFNGGPMPTKDMKIVWMNYHFIDSNYDGKVDILIYNVDLDGDKFIDEHGGAWIYDSDYDGVIDSAEYLGPGLEIPVAEIEDGFTIKGATGEQRLLKKDMKETILSLSRCLAEISELSNQGK